VILSSKAFSASVFISPPLCFIAVNSGTIPAF
jgi:hypothetical protein